jgi:hypothetical protein
MLTHPLKFVYKIYSLCSLFILIDDIVYTSIIDDIAYTRVTLCYRPIKMAIKIQWKRYILKKLTCDEHSSDIRGYDISVQMEHVRDVILIRSWLG